MTSRRSGSTFRTDSQAIKTLPKLEYDILIIGLRTLVLLMLIIATMTNLIIAAKGGACTVGACTVGASTVGACTDQQTQSACRGSNPEP